jgi:hypothetical protein
MDADLKGNTRPGTLLEKHQAPRLSSEVRGSRPTTASLQRGCFGEHRRSFSGGKVGLLQEVTHLGKRLKIGGETRLDSGK